ncbi:MAG: NAD-dependent epimerase/dehydratase family protein [Microbacteriaceae bacterium]|nr:NAD-dependent epimerase/dehydratase family protein [Microbacteriaceae bacterium]
MSLTRDDVVLVTGGAGFIGSALSRAAIGSASRWIAFDSLHEQIHDRRERPQDLADDAELVIGDVASAADWDRVLSDATPTVIIHLAAETGTSQSLQHATRHATVNVLGTAMMMDALVRHDVHPRHILLASSRAVYGEGVWNGADGEFSPGPRSHAQLEAKQWDFGDAVPVPSHAARTPPRPVNVYGATKLAQENLLEAWCGSYGVPLTVLRFQNVYGPGQSLINSYTGIVSLFSQMAEEGRAIPLYEDGRIVRDFVFIDDVVAAIRAGIASGKSGLFDVGSGDPSTISQVAELIAKYHNAPPPRVTEQYRDGDVRYAACGIEATVAALGWRPQVALEEGIGHLQRWIAQQEQRITTAR